MQMTVLLLVDYSTMCNRVLCLLGDLVPGMKWCTNGTH